MTARIRVPIAYIYMLAQVAAAAAAAQTTADGLQAIARGDYAAAARILEPIADRQPSDSIAQFALATIYYGDGSLPNRFRACGLFLKAADSSSPVAPPAATLARTIHRDNATARQLCVSAAASGWSVPGDSTFTLAADHHVRLDGTRLLVSYQGVEKPASVTLGGPGVVYLPTRLTQVEVTRPSATVRHFIEFFYWIPVSAQDGAPWSLMWTAIEIVGGDARPLAFDTVMPLMTAARPGTDSSATAFAGLRATADGSAEWFVTRPEPRSGAIKHVGEGR